jgi:ribosomal protein S18 acetylase RimI-like enzyme
MDFALQAAAPHGLVLRPVTDKDHAFLEALYISTRAEEVAATGWPPEMQQAFLRQQHAAQHAHFKAHYGHASKRILEQAEAAIGRLYWYETADDLHIVDIALLPQWRGQGIGEALLTDLAAHAGARGKPLTIYVEKTNPALTLYRRLGFVAVEEQGIYDFMRRPLEAGVS